MAGVKGRSGTNKGKDKPFKDALRLEINKAGDDQKALRRIAAKLISLAEEGDMQAIKEVADRLDGKAPQAIIGDDDEDPVNILHTIERIIVDPANQDGESVPPAPETSTL